MLTKSLLLGQYHILPFTSNCSNLSISILYWPWSAVLSLSSFVLLLSICLVSISAFSSSVILSSNDEGTEGKSDTFTVQNDSGNKFVNGGHSWSSDEANIVGKALDIEFKDTRIVPESEMYSASNPYGWYSWRLVVKQTEQEYYNVYAPHPADDWNNIDLNKLPIFEPGLDQLILNYL